MDFRTNIRNLGLKAEDEEIDALFNRMDDDGSGSMEISELRAALQVLQNEAAQAAEEKAEVTKILTALRRKATYSEVTITAASDYDESRASHEHIARNQPLPLKLGEAIKDIPSDELMARWTSKKKGEINRMEFRQHVRSLVPDSDFKETDQLFAQMDADGGGHARRGRAAAVAREADEERGGGRRGAQEGVGRGDAEEGVRRGGDRGAARDVRRGRGAGDGGGGAAEADRTGRRSGRSSGCAC